MTARTFIPLPARYIERGEVNKEIIFHLGDFSVSMLHLKPNSKVAEHTHDTDNEIYVLVLGKKCLCTVNGVTETLKSGAKSICLKGNKHSLENPSSVSTIRVLSIKYPEGK